MPVEGERPKVSIIIPAYNEAENIDEILCQTHRAVESSNLSYEIIFVDDGSTDRTRNLAYGHNVIVLHNDKNQGKGAALRKGFAQALGDIIVTMDADGSHNANDVPKLIWPVLNGSSVALGTRFGSKEGKDSTSRMNLLGNSLINLAIRLLTGKRITDSQCGFRAIKREVLDEVEITSAGFEMETELLIKALRNGNVLTEVPLGVRKRRNGRSHVKPLRDGIRIMSLIVKASLA